MEIARTELGLELVERSIDRGELYSADEIFFTGTAVGICYVTSIDRRTVGDGTIGPVTQRLANLYQRIVTGRESSYSSWLTRIYASARVKV
jgi:branched-chain amino acid aminotransferase